MLLVMLYGWLMLRMARGPKIRWSATTLRKADELVVTISGKNRFYWEVGGVSLFDARLDGQRAKNTVLPVLLSETAPRRSKSATLQFALADDGSAKQTLEIVVTEKNRRCEGPVTHTIAVDSQPMREQR